MIFRLNLFQLYNNCFYQVYVKCNIKFRPKLKEYIELLISKNIPLIIESGGVTQFLYSSFDKSELNLIYFCNNFFYYHEYF